MQINRVLLVLFVEIMTSERFEKEVLDGSARDESYSVMSD